MAIRKRFMSIQTSVTRQLWPKVLATPVFVPLCDYLAIAPIGSSVFLWFNTFLGIPFLGAVIGVLALPFFFFRKSTRPSALAWFLICLSFSLVYILGTFAGDTIRNHAFNNLAERSQPLINAITKFEKENGTPPESLRSLVPEYLETVPKTGMMAYPTYEYEVGNTSAIYAGNPWVIRVFTPNGGINFDQFMYFPLQNYPARNSSGYFRRIGEWAYLHE